MWLRLVAWVVIASSITAFFAPLDRVYVYGIVLGIGLPLFAMQPPFKKPKPSPQKSANVIHLEEYRRKKDQENQQ